MNRVLVTGAAGFIGSHLCRRLVADGVEVVGLDDLSDGSAENIRDVPEVRLVEADVRDAGAVSAAARGCDAIMHQAAKRSVVRSFAQPRLTADVNILGTLNVLLAARDEGAVVVSASSSSVYGDQTSFPLRESQEPRPRSPYAFSKLAAEVCCTGMYRSDGVRALSLRYFNVYGPGQDAASEYAVVVPLFIAACLDGARPVIHGDGEQSRDFTYVDDVVEANVRAAGAPADAFGAAYNIGGGGRPTTVNRLLASIAREVGVEPEPLYEPTRPGDVRTTQADVSRARARFGYEPRVGIEEGIRRTVASFRGVLA
jgi:nucleoside-diphosphate-sugar epimerase